MYSRQYRVSTGVGGFLEINCKQAAINRKAHKFLKERNTPTRSSVVFACCGEGEAEGCGDSGERDEGEAGGGGEEEGGGEGGGDEMDSSSKIFCASRAWCCSCFQLDYF